MEGISIGNEKCLPSLIIDANSRVNINLQSYETPTFLSIIR